MITVEDYQLGRLPADFELYGCQVPTFEFGDTYTKTLGPSVHEYTEEIFGDLYDYQRDLLDPWNAYHPDTKKWVHRIVGLSIARRNGKTEGCKRCAVYRAAILGHKVLWTAHLADTADMTFNEIYEAIQDNPKLREAVAVDGVRRGNGKTSIRFKSGGIIKFATRTKNQARGTGFDLLVVDEAQELSQFEWQALGKITHAPKNSPSGQIILLGTPPNDTNNGDFFEDFRNRILEDKPKLHHWAEWAATKRDDDSHLYDLEEWARANPALGYHLDIEGFIVDYVNSTPDGFARESLGMYGTNTVSTVVPMDAWNRNAFKDGETPGVLSEMVMAVDTNHNTFRTTVSVAGLLQNGMPYVEVLESKLGTEWVAEYIEERMKLAPFKAVIMDHYSASRRLFFDELKRRRVRVTVTATADYITACTQFADGVMTGQVRHLNQTPLNDSLKVCTKRELQGGFGLAAKGGADITCVVSAVLALWGTKAEKRMPRPVREKRVREKHAPILS